MLADHVDSVMECQNLATNAQKNVFGLQAGGYCFADTNVAYDSLGSKQGCDPLGSAWGNQIYTSPGFVKPSSATPPPPSPVPPPSGTPSPVPSASINPPPPTPPPVRCGNQLSYPSDQFGQMTHVPYPVNDQSSFDTVLSISGSVTKVFNDNGKIAEISPPSTYNPNVVTPGCWYRSIWQRNKPDSYGNKEVFVLI
jgi:hypothetical protein